MRHLPIVLLFLWLSSVGEARWRIGNRQSTQQNNYHENPANPVSPRQGPPKSPPSRTPSLSSAPVLPTTPVKPKAPTKNAASDRAEVTRISEELEADPAYQTWVKTFLHPDSSVNGIKLDEAFLNSTFEAILASHPIRNDLKERLRRAIKQDYILNEIPLIDLLDMLRLEISPDKVILTPLDSVRAKNARERWKKEPLASKIKLALQAGDEFSLLFGTQFGPREVKGVDAIFAAALSEPSLKQFSGRQITFKDKDGKTSALPVILGKSGDIVKTRGILSSFWKDEQKIKLLTLAGSEDPNDEGRPPGNYYIWSAKDDPQYTLHENRDAVDSFDAAKIATQVVGNPELKHAMLEQYLQWRRGASGDWNAQAVAENPVIKASLESSLRGKEGLRDRVTKAVSESTRKMAKALMDPATPGNVSVTAVPVGAHVGVIPKKDEAIPRIALVYPGNVSGFHIPSARNSGAEVFTVRNAAEAKAVIQKMYAKYGKKMDVIFASHGNHSYMEHILSTNDPMTVDLINSTEGMIKRAYLMGCNVGGGTQYLPNHLIKQFVAHGADSAMGVDRYLWADGNKFYLNEWGGNIVSATSNYEKQFQDLKKALPPRDNAELRD